MIKQIKKLIKNEWVAVIFEDEKTIDTTLCHLQDQNPECLYCVQDINDLGLTINDILDLRSYKRTLKE